MNRAFHLCALALVLFGGNALAVDRPIRQPVTDGAVGALVRDAQDGVWHEHSLLRAALVASHCDERRIAAYEEKLHAWRADVRRETAHVSSARDRAATILAVLHREVLTGAFDPHCGDLTATIDRGRYNCATATLLFLLLAKDLDLPAEAIQSPGHVRVQIKAPEPLVVETTCPDWFSRPQPPAANQGQVLDEVALVAKLPYNRGVAALETSNFAVAVESLALAAALDPRDAAARQNLLAAYNNGALARSRTGQFPEALAWLEEARRIDPEQPATKRNELHIVQRWVVSLCEHRQFAEADELLRAGQSRHPREAFYSAARIALHKLWAEHREAAH